jgi:hypothetical protein
VVTVQSGGEERKKYQRSEGSEISVTRAVQVTVEKNSERNSEEDYESLKTDLSTSSDTGEVRL